MKTAKILATFLLIIFTSCSGELEGEAKQVTETNQFTFIHSEDVDVSDFETFHKLFWDMCNNYKASQICSIMTEKQDTRVYLGGCSLFPVNLAKYKLFGMTINRSEGSEHGPGQDLYLCVMRTESIKHEIAHAILNEYQRSYYGISPQIHEACAISMTENNGANWKTWSEIKQ
jgi:hypothetical protein